MISFPERALGFTLPLFQAIKGYSVLWLNPIPPGSPIRAPRRKDKAKIQLEAKCEILRVSISEDCAINGNAFRLRASERQHPR